MTRSATRTRVGPKFQKPILDDLHLESGWTASEHVAALVPKDLKEPGAEGAAGVESVEGLVGLHKGFLERVARIFGISHHPEGESESLRFIGSNQGFVESGVSRPASVHKLAFDFRLQ
jgi:hypothetical protein